MTQRPVVSLLVQETEVPVGFRTSGPNSRLIVVEAIGDLVLRNGKKLICLKLRRDPSSGLEYTDYSGSKNMTSSPYTSTASVMSEEVPAINPMIAQADEVENNIVPSPTYNEPQQQYMNNGYPVQGGSYPVVQPMVNQMQMTNDYGAYYPTQSAAAPSIYNQNMAPIQPIPANVTASPQASAGIVGVMSQMPTVSAPHQNSQFATSETISIELGTHADITQLEGIWEQILAKNSDVLSSYEPYYSVDTTADGNMRELFRLRVGPVKDITTADKLCKRLGRRGFGCSVVRVQ